VLEEGVDVETELELRSESLHESTESFLVVGGLAESQIPERLQSVERSHSCGTGGCDQLGHARRLPGLVTQLDGVEQTGIERIEKQAQEPLVARTVIGELYENRSEAVAERAHALAEGGTQRQLTLVGYSLAELDGEAKAWRRLRGPGLELALRRQPPNGAVQLDGVELPGVGGEQLVPTRPERVEAPDPGRIREAGGSRIQHGGTL